ncbi:MAG: hypothetical protein ACOX9R_07375 [Armatimonadota bacterium]|jgi:hypothetical protein
MRRFIAPAVISTLVLLLVAGVASASMVKIVVDAADYTSIKPSMVKTSTTSSEVANKTYIQIPLRRPHATTETGPADDGNAVYRINVPTAGTYQFWARTWWYDSCGNSFFVIVDNKPAVFIEDATYQTWHWVKGPRIQLSAGQHTIRIQNREDGARLDQFMLINNTQYVPTRIESRTAQYVVKP